MDIIGPLQLRVMNIIWDVGPTTVRNVHDELNDGQPKNAKLAYTTILTVMRNLARRKLLTQNAVGRSHLFEPTVSHDQYKQSVLKCMSIDFFDGDLAQLQRYVKKFKAEILDADLSFLADR